MRNFFVKKMLSGSKVEEKHLEQGDLQKLFVDIARFRAANRKFILPDIYDQEDTRHYKIIQVNNTESYG